MASTTEFQTAAPGFVHRAVHSLAEFVESFSHARAAAAEIDYLYGLSDAQLAARGLNRATIPQHVAARHLGV